MAMKFWGAEIEPRTTLRLKVQDGMLINITNIALGVSEGETGETVILNVKSGNTNTVFTLYSKIPQFKCELMFDKEFELSHNWEKGSVHVLGFKSPNIEVDEKGVEQGEPDSEDEEMDVQ